MAKLNAEDITLTIERVTDESRLPKPAHKFDYTRVGTDLYFEVGHFDLRELRDAIVRMQAGEEEGDPVKLYVTDRFTLTPTGVVELHAIASKLVDDLRKQGIHPDQKPAATESPEKEAASK